MTGKIGSDGVEWHKNVKYYKKLDKPVVSRNKIALRFNPHDSFWKKKYIWYTFAFEEG